MTLKASYFKRTFRFSFSARTSRGVLKQRDSWFLKVWDTSDPEVYGVGEAAPVVGLSVEKPTELERQLKTVVGRLADGSSPASLQSPKDIHSHFKALSLSSSVQFAVETAFLDLAHGGKRVIFQNEFVKGKAVPINGLVWMGGLDIMLQQVSIKIDEGFTCIKLKVGGLNFEKDLDILQFIRRKYFRDVITLRLDANGAFKSDQVLLRLMDLAQYDIHSIEQPLPVGSPFLPELCKKSPIPIALDEELIGVRSEQKPALLDRIQPHYLVLKPTLHGGLYGCAEWISLAEERNIRWWITSAMESNIGLNAIAQFVSNYEIGEPQGLGTGSIFNDNIPSPLEVKKGSLVYNTQENWEFLDES
ncbi:MAG: o-succinylbenzoate synthase [Cytophagales bacterium]|nr:o-succinylbenzoate synthase [Cytophagales bacterium]